MAANLFFSKPPATFARMPVVANKIAVPPPPQTPARRRLLDAVAASAERQRATILCGRAGTGKTALAAAFAHRCAEPVAWLTIDAADSVVESFAAHLGASVAAARRAGAPASAATPPAVDRAGVPPLEPESLADWLAASLAAPPTSAPPADGAAPAPRLAVFDALDHLYDADWFAAFFSRLLAALEPGCHVVAACRSLPPLPLWRLRSKQAVAVVDEPMLLFTAADILELCAWYGLDGEQARRIAAAGSLRPAVVDAAARWVAARRDAEWLRGAEAPRAPLAFNPE